MNEQASTPQESGELFSLSFRELRASVTHSNATLNDAMIAFLEAEGLIYEPGWGDFSRIAQLMQVDPDDSSRTKLLNGELPLSETGLLEDAQVQIRLTEVVTAQLAYQDDHVKRVILPNFVHLSQLQARLQSLVGARSDLYFHVVDRTLVGGLRRLSLNSTLVDQEVQHSAELVLYSATDAMESFEAKSTRQWIHIADDRGQSRRLSIPLDTSRPELVRRIEHTLYEYEEHQASEIVVDFSSEPDRVAQLEQTYEAMLEGLMKYSSVSTEPSEQVALLTSGSAALTQMLAIPQERAERSKQIVDFRHLFEDVVETASAVLGLIEQDDLRFTFSQQVGEVLQQSLVLFSRKVGQVEGADFLRQNAGMLAATQQFFEPVPQAGPADPSEPTAIPTRDLTVYSGPDVDAYPPVGIVRKGEAVQIRGMSSDAKWWQIAHVQRHLNRGWIAREHDLNIRGRICPCSEA